MMNFSNYHEFRQLKLELLFFNWKKKSVGGSISLLILNNVTETFSLCWVLNPGPLARQSSTPRIELKVFFSQSL